jgi:Uma2 family endonuclease
MTTQPAPWLTPEQYLALDRAAETKSEYVDGLLVAMGGAQENHVLITVNLVRELSLQFKDTPCRLYVTDMRVRITDGGMYAYPDLAAVCDKPLFGDDQFDVLLNPVLIVEVLSTSTEGYDRGLKSARYRKLASLQDYVLVAQDRVSVERFSRQGEQWVLTEATSLDDVMDLPSVGCTVALRDVYDKVEGLSGAV